MSATNKSLSKKKSKTPEKAAVGSTRKKTGSKKDDGASKPKRISALDAAAAVLKSAGRPMRAQELIDAMAEKRLWKSPAGATPHATLYAAMVREERDKGAGSRFRKIDRGMFEITKAGQSSTRA